MRIAVIEDNKSLALGIAYRLRDQGHAVDVLHEGEDGDLHLAHEGADLVILDVNLPGIDGLEILRRIRARKDNTPVLLLTARSELSDRVGGLDAGADDYLVKPFEMAELEARIRALSRRRGLESPVVENIGALVFDRGARALSHGDARIDIPRRELAAFECLMNRRGQLVSKSVLADHIYGTGADVDEKVVEVHVSRLRKKLAQYGIRIKVARGLGYLMEDDT